FHTIPVPLDLVWPEALRIPLACQGPCRPRQEHPQASLEVHADAESEEVTVGQCVVIATEEIGVREASGIGVLVHRVHADAHGLGTLVEQTIGAIAIDVVGEGDVRRQVHACENVAVVSQSTQTVAPGVSGYEAVVTIFRCIQTKDGVAAIAELTLALKSTHMGVADFTNQSYATGTQHLVDKVRKSSLDLSNFFTVVSAVLLTSKCRINKPRYQVGGIDLHRSVGSIADFSGPRSTGWQSG